jgi:hypothetical protein
MGAHHNVEEDPSNQPKPYQHGYCGPGFFTTMSYQERGCSSQIKYWSTPDKTYNGTPVGNALSANVARLLAENAPTVAAFELSDDNPPPPPWTVSAAVSPTHVAVGQAVTATATATAGDAQANRRFVVKLVSPSGATPRTCSALRNFAAGVPQSLACSYAPLADGTWTVWVRVLDAATGVEVYRLRPAATFTVSAAHG